MADRATALSIVIRAVDKSTGVLGAVNKRLDAITKPTRELGKALKELGETSGLNSVVEGFRGVGGALRGLMSTALAGVGIIGAAGVGLHSLVEEFDNLGDKSEKLAVTTDFLAGMRHAAERSGAAVEDLDGGITAFGVSMGQLRAGGGRMLKFLSDVSPALAEQLRATKGNEAAFRLLADAMAAISDPQKRMALAMKTVGNTNLVPLLARGSKGLLELQGEFAGAAGSMEEAAEGAGKVDDQLKKLKAATQGVKAALVTGLSPALQTIIDDMAKWLVDHRSDIETWAKDIGEKLPGAVDAVVKAVKGAVEDVRKFTDDIGGLKVGFVAVAAVIAGPMVAAIARLSAALLTTPLGRLLLVVAAIDKVLDLPEGIEYDDALSPAENIRRQSALAAARGGAGEQAGGGTGAAAAISPAALAAAAGPGAGQPATATIKVDFANAPPGTRVTADPRGTADIDLSVGYQMFGLN